MIFYVVVAGLASLSLTYLSVRKLSWQYVLASLLLGWLLWALLAVFLIFKALGRLTCYGR
jgi:hypothetical protein